MKIGILTSGGDCPGLNAVIRGVVLRGTMSHNIEFVGIRDGWRGVVDGDFFPLTRHEVKGLAKIGGTILGTNNRANPFKYYGRGGADVSDEVVAYYNELGLDALVALGAVIRGDTYHFEIVCNESAAGISSVVLEFGIPIGNGILTVENEEQALVRADPKQKDKGGEAAKAALALYALKERFG